MSENDHTSCGEGAPLNKYTLYWLTGVSEVIEGESAAQAMNAAGYGAGALRALDFYIQGDNHSYKWDSKNRHWVPNE